MTATVAAPVDRILRDAGLRLRSLPGEVSLEERRAFAPRVEPTASLAADIGRCLDGDPSGIVVTRVTPRNGAASPLASCDCGGAMASVLIDFALGENKGLVVENLDGSWCWSCGSGVAHNAQEEFSRRMARFDPGDEGEVVPSLLYETPRHPRSLQFEVTTRCNLTCPYCTHGKLPVKRNLPFGSFAAMLDRVDVRQLDNFDFTGLGEPMMHTELPRMVAEIRSRNSHTEIRVVTNGTLLTPRFYEPLCEAGITSIAVSIDSLDPERFARSREGATIDRVQANVESLVHYRDRRGAGTPRVKIKAVLIEEPYEDAERLMAWCARIGIDMPHFSRLDPRQSIVATYDQPWLDNHWSDADDGRLLAWAEERWRELAPDQAGHNTDPPPGTWPATPAAGLINPSLLSDPALCRWAVDAAFVTLDGESLSCCETMIDLPRVTWGSLADKTLEELWTGPLLWGYRLPLALGRLPAGCVGCPQAPLHGVPL